MSCGPTLESEARVLGECLRERDVRCVLKFVPNAEIQAFKKANVDVVGLAQLATESISIEPPLVIETSNVGGVMPGGASFTIVGSGQALRLLPISLNLFYSEDGIVSPGLLETLLLHRWLASSAPQQSWMRGGGKLAHQDRILIAHIDPNSGALTLDTGFRDKGAATPGVSFDRATWPHGATGKAVPHGAVFSRASN